MRYKNEDLIGKKFGKLKVIKYSHKIKHRYFDCECSCDPKTLKKVRGDSLINGSIKSCGCLHAEIQISKRYNLVGKTYYNLLVVEFLGQKKNKNVWKCRCLCGNFREVITGDLQSGRVKNCKKCLYKHNSVDLQNKKFGLLTVKRKVILSAHKLPKWECICECGNITHVITAKLITGHTKSCGCLRKRTGKNSPMFDGYEEISAKYFKNIINGADRRGLSFDLNIKDAWDVFIKQNRKCALSGIEIKFDKENRISTASLDRIDPSVGYHKDNIQWVHKHINKIKFDFDEEYFISLCKAVAKNANK